MSGRIWPISGPAITLAIVLSLASALPARGQTNSRAPQAIYATNCGYCHGANVGPVFRGRRLPVQAVEYMVRNGRGAMPAFRPTEITPAEIAALARWINASGPDPKEHGR